MPSMHINISNVGSKRMVPDYSVVLSNTMRSKGHKIKHKKFHFSMRKNFFTLRVTEHGNSCPERSWIIGLLCSLNKKNQDKIGFQVFSQKMDAVPECSAMGVKAPYPLLPEKSGSGEKTRAVGTTLSLILLMGFTTVLSLHGQALVVGGCVGLSQPGFW